MSIESVNEALSENFAAYCEQRRFILRMGGVVGEIRDAMVAFLKQHPQTEISSSFCKYEPYYSVYIRLGQHDSLKDCTEVMASVGDWKSSQRNDGSSFDFDFICGDRKAGTQLYVKFWIYPHSRSTVCRKVLVSSETKQVEEINEKYTLVCIDPESTKDNDDTQ